MSTIKQNTRSYNQHLFAARRDSTEILEPGYRVGFDGGCFPCSLRADRSTAGCLRPPGNVPEPPKIFYWNRSWASEDQQKTSTTRSRVSLPSLSDTFWLAGAVQCSAVRVVLEIALPRGTLARSPTSRSATPFLPNLSPPTTTRDDTARRRDRAYMI